MKRYDRKIRITVLAVLLMAVPCLAAEEETSKETVWLEELVVTATKTEKLAGDVPATVEVISDKEIEKRTSFFADDLMSNLPGVYLKRSNFADFTASSAMSIRGISGGDRTLVLYNGIPLNEPYWGSGHVEFGAISMDDVKQLEVVKGPFSALYGGNAMAGVINVITEIPEKDEVMMKFNYSSFNTMQTFFKASKRLNEKWRIAATFEKITSDGERNAYIDTVSISEITDITGRTAVTGVKVSKDKFDDTQYFVGDVGKQSWDQEKIGVTLNFTPNDMHKFTLQTTYSDRTIDHHDTRNYLQDEIGTFFEDGDFYFEQDSTYYGGTVSPVTFLRRMRVTPRNEKNILSALTYKGSFRNTDVTSQLGYVNHDLTRIKSKRTGATIYGGPAVLNEIEDYSIYYDGNVTHPVKNHQITFGLSVRYNDATELLSEVSNWKDFNSVTVTTSDVSGNNYLYSAYVQDDIALNNNLELFVGGRYDTWDNSGGTTISRSRDGSEEGIIETESSVKGQFSPKIALLYKVSEDTILRGSWGMAFKPPTLSDLYRSTISFGKSYSYSNPDLNPETTSSYEIGITQKLMYGRTVVNAALFYNEIKDMITKVLMDYEEDGLDVYKNINVGKSEAMGFEIAVQQKILSWLDLNGNYTYTKSEVKENDIVPESVGKELELVPENMFNLELSTTFDRLWAKLIYEYADKVYSNGDMANEQIVWGVYGSYDEIRLLNMKIGYELNEHTELSYGCQNMLDRDYFRGTGTGLADGRRHILEVVVTF